MNDIEKIQAIAANALAGKKHQITLNYAWVDRGPSDFIVDLMQAPNLDCLRIKPEWKLPDPPEGKKWVRADYTESDLPNGTRPLLRGEQIQRGDECIWVNGSYGWEPCDGIVGLRAESCEHHKARTKRPLPGQEIAPGRNHHGLTVAQVGEGYRILDEDEIHPRRTVYKEIEDWNPALGRWDAAGWQGCGNANTYRTRLTREELAALDAPKTRAWSKPGDVPGPVCWIRNNPPGGQEWLVVCVHASGVSYIGGIKVPDGRAPWLAWDELSRCEYSTDRINWQPCTVKEAR